MKTLMAMVIGVMLTTTAYPAAAYVVAVTTSIPSQKVADDDDLEAAVKSAIDDVLQHAIAFSPTFVSVQSARVVGGRVYLLLLIGDDDGAATLKALAGLSAPAAPEPRDRRRRRLSPVVKAAMIAALLGTGWLAYHVVEFHPLTSIEQMLPRV